MDRKTRTLVAASVAGLVAAMGMLGNAAQSHAADSEDVPCYGVNKCKGVGDCGGKATSCAGTNACAGQGFMKLNKDLCLRLQGGRLTAEPQQPS